MKKCIILLYLLVLSFLSAHVFANDQSGKKIWIYDSVSDIDLLGQHSQEMTEQFNKLYGQVTITTDINKKELSVDNQLLDNSHVCTIRYININKTPVEYFSSQKTVDMYQHVFNHRGITLPEKLSVLMSVFPEQDCPSPYQALLVTGKYLVFSEKNYILFFKNKPANVNGKKEKGSDLSSYLYRDNPAKVFDGSSRERYYFVGKSLPEAYRIVRMTNNGGHQCILKIFL